MAKLTQPGPPEIFRADSLLAEQSCGEPGTGRSLLVASTVLHAVLLGVLVALVALVPQSDPPDRVEVVFYSRSPELPVPPAPRKKAPPKIETERIPAEVALVEPVVTSPPPPPREASPPVARVEPPKPAAIPPPPVATPRPQPPRPEVRTDVFAENRPAPVAPQSAKRRTRTGAFAQPETTAAGEQPEPRAVAARRVGEFEVAAASQEPAPAQRAERVVAASSFGDGPAVPASRQTATERPRAVTTAAFGSSDADGPSRPPGKPSASVKQGGFGDGVVAAEPRQTRKKPEANPDTPVEIVSKPRPLYTTEARELKVEGEVVLEVVFPASGPLRVLGVVSSLGHGLDEAAVEAARKIEFTPARRNGQPVDHTAVLRIVFQIV